MIIREYWERRVRGLEKPEAYWYKIAGRRFRRLRKNRARELACFDPEEHLRAVASVAGGPGAVDGDQVVMAVLRKLPLKQRQVLWLREIAGFTEAETAKIMNVRVGTVKSQLHDAKSSAKGLFGNGNCVEVGHGEHRGTSARRGRAERR